MPNCRQTITGIQAIVISMCIHMVCGLPRHCCPPPLQMANYYQQKQQKQLVMLAVTSVTTRIPFTLLRTCLPRSHQTLTERCSPRLTSRSCSLFSVSWMNARLTIRHSTITTKRPCLSVVVVSSTQSVQPMRQHGPNIHWPLHRLAPPIASSTTAWRPSHAS